MPKDAKYINARSAALIASAANKRTLFEKARKKLLSQMGSDFEREIVQALFDILDGTRTKGLSKDAKASAEILYGWTIPNI